jgi:hypothetical protein
LGATSSTVEGSPAEKKRRARKYQTDFLTFGFTYQLVNGEERLLCVVCSEVLANNSSNARNLRRHLTTKLESLANKPLLFLRKQLEIRKQSNLMRTAVTTSTKALLASSEVSYLIVKNKKPHTIGETIISSSSHENVRNYAW